MYGHAEVYQVACYIDTNFTWRNFVQNKMGIHCFISGLVQGVFFRKATQIKAKELGLTGWVRNVPDGRVEVLAFGKTEKVTELYEWLKLGGPPRARVSEVVYEEAVWEEHGEFLIN